jgi:hypothetical protein
LKRMSALLTLSVGSLAPIAVPSLQAAERMRAGQWEITSTSDGQSRTNTHCDSAARVKDANGSAEEVQASLEKGAAKLHCTVEDLKVGTDSISYRYVCPQTTTTSVTTYHGDTFDSQVTSKGAAGGEHASHTTGRRLGECP